MPEMLVRLKKGKKTFEILVEEGLVPKYRDGKLKQSDVVLTPTVFTDASKGTKASIDQLQSAFETDDITSVIDTILLRGDAQQSASERKDKLDAKRQEVIAALRKAYVAPDGKPLPQTRVENALTTVKARIDVDQPAERQAETLSEKLAAVMPLKRAKADMEAIITVPVAKVGAAAGIIRKHAKVQREAYGNSAKFEVEVFSYDLLLKDLTKVTDGDFEFTVVNGTDVQSGVGAAPSPSEKPKGKKGKKKNKK